MLFLQVVPVVSKITYRQVVSNSCFQSSDGQTVNHTEAPAGFRGRAAGAMHNRAIGNRILPLRFTTQLYTPFVGGDYILLSSQDL